MKTVEIYQRLKEEFKDAILEINAEAKDPYVVLSAEKIKEVMKFLRSEPDLDFDFLSSISGVDYPEHFEVVYHLFSYSKRHKAVIKTRLSKKGPEVDSITHLWPSADWLEREVYDLMGLQFRGHPNLRRILLPEDWQGYPLRKDYVQPEEYHGIPHKD